jgi:hypothetical protein
MPSSYERHIWWTTYLNPLAWVNNFRAFMIKKEFAWEGIDGVLIFNEEMLHWILKIDKTKISLNGSKTIAGG